MQAHDPLDPISAWLAGFKAGDPAAVERLWQRYFTRLVGLARRTLGSAAVGGNEEDVALSAFHSFHQRAQQGRFPKLDDRNDLWKLLVTITVRKAFKTRRKDRRQVPLADSALVARELAREPSPELAAAVKDQYARLMELLDDASRRIAQLSLESYSNEEIAGACGLSLSTVERKRRLIRQKWEREIER